MKPLRMRSLVIPVLCGVAAFVNYRVPFLSAAGRPLSVEGLFLISFGTVWLVNGLTDPERKPSRGELAILSIVILGPFAFVGPQVWSETGSVSAGILGSFKGIYQSSPHLLVASALGLIPTIGERVRRHFRGERLSEQPK